MRPPYLGVDDHLHPLEVAVPLENVAQLALGSVDAEAKDAEASRHVRVVPGALVAAPARHRAVRVRAPAPAVAAVVRSRPRPTANLMVNVTTFQK